MYKINQTIYGIEITRIFPQEVVRSTNQIRWKYYCISYYVLVYHRGRKKPFILDEYQLSTEINKRMQHCRLIKQLAKELKIKLYE